MSTTVRHFPVLGTTGSVKYVKWEMLNEEWAQRNHYQSLSKLASRGGLSWEELYANYYKQSFRNKIDPKLFKEMVDTISC